MNNCFKCGRKMTSLRYARFSANRHAWAHTICPKRKRKSKQGRIAKPKTRRRGLGVDWFQTDRLHEQGKFRDGKSVVKLDGSEVLYGEDYKARVREVLARHNGMCWASVGVGVFCGRPADDAHHKIKRSKGRDDRSDNLLPVCRFHHNEMHKEFQTQFRAARRAPGVGDEK